MREIEVTSISLRTEKFKLFFENEITGTDVVGVLHRFVGRTPNVGHLLHHAVSPGKNAFL